MATHFGIKIAPDATGSDIDFVTPSSGRPRQGMVLSHPDFDVDAFILTGEAGAADPGIVVRDVRTGNTVFYLHAAASTNATVIKSSPGKLFHVRIYNTTTGVLYTKFYNKTTTPAPVSDSVFFTLPCQAGVWTTWDSFNGAEFTNGLGVATVTGISPTNNTAVAADSLLITVERK
jgi:hypothetical protein